jgi:hypothetical protein
MRVLIAAAVGLIVVGNAFPLFGIPTPTMSEEEMLKACDVAVEGQITAVKLAKRWLGDRPGIDTGYEHGTFECSLLVEKGLKGKFKPGETVRYTVEAYMEGRWDNPPQRGFVYEGTQAAVTPGTKLRLYLKWNAEKKEYQRVHFNSGFTVLAASNEAFPKKAGETVSAAKAKPEGKPAPGEKQPGQRDPAPIVGKPVDPKAAAKMYIVLVKGDSQTETARLEKAYGFKASYVYKTVMRGFAASLTDEQVEKLRRDAAVLQLTHDQVNRLHTPGAPR